MIFDTLRFNEERLAAFLDKRLNMTIDETEAMFKRANQNVLIRKTRVQLIEENIISDKIRARAVERHLNKLKTIK